MPWWTWENESTSGCSYVRIKWHRDNLSSTQYDGGCYANMFDVLSPNGLAITAVAVDYMKAVRAIYGSY